MHLRDRSRGDGHGIDVREACARSVRELAREHRLDGREWRGRHRVLQSRELSCVAGPEQVGPGAQNLAELDERGAQTLEHGGDAPPPKRLEPRLIEPARAEPRPRVGEHRQQGDERDVDEAQRQAKASRAGSGVSPVVKAGQRSVPSAGTCSRPAIRWTRRRSPELCPSVADRKTSTYSRRAARSRAGKRRSRA